MVVGVWARVLGAVLVCLTLYVGVPSVGATDTLQAQVPVQLPPPVPPAATSAGSITGGVWQWLRSEYSDDSTVVAADPSRYTLQLVAGGRLSIQADCNRVGGTYTLEGSRLMLQLGPTTLVACGPDSQADTYLRDLERVVTYVFNATNLLLNMRLDTGNMLFSPRPPASLTGVPWRVTGYNNGRGAVTSVVSATVLTAEFDDAGRISGDSGCNNYMGPYSIAGSTISIGPLASTRRACVSDAANTQEQAFLAALTAARTYDIVGDRMQLRDADGALQVDMVRPTN
jgi:heat shock protein HslJ